MAMARKEGEMPAKVFDRPVALAGYKDAADAVEARFGIPIIYASQNRPLSQEKWTRASIARR